MHVYSVKCFLFLPKKGALLDVGDHIPNVFNEEGCKIKHLLIEQDCTLKPCVTKYGTVKFLQV